MNNCHCLKIDSKQCTREASKITGQNPLYCWQHQNCTTPIGTTEIKSVITKAKPSVENKGVIASIDPSVESKAVIARATPSMSLPTVKVYPLIDNDVDYINELALEHKIYYNTLPYEQKLAVDEYTKGYYVQMNNYLRGASDNTSDEHEYTVELVNNLKIAIENAPPTKEPIIVYRGINLAKLPEHLRREMGSLKVGDLVDMFKMGFNSASLTASIAYLFAGPACCVFMLYLPAGVKGIYVGKQSEMMHEDEFILGPGPSFRVFQFPDETFPLKLNVSKKGDKNLYRMACNDCKEIFHVRKTYEKDLECDEKKGCYVISKN